MARQKGKGKGREKLKDSESKCSSRGGHENQKKFRKTVSATSNSVLKVPIFYE